MGSLVRRGTAWYVQYKDVDGVRRMRRCHQPTKEAARRYLLEVEARVARGVIGIPEPVAPAIKVSALVARFLAEYCRPRVKDLVKYRKCAGVALKRALATLGEVRCDAVTARDIARLRDELARSCAPGSAALSLTYLKTMFAWALRQGLLAANPFLGVELPRRHDSIEYLSADELRRLLATADRLAAAGGLTERGLAVAVHFALRTGLRKGELFGLRWRDLDLDTGRLDVAHSYATTPKSGKTRHLRLPADTVPLLNAWRHECPRTPEGVVFPRLSSDGTWGMAKTSGFMFGLNELLGAADCRPLSRAWHAMRHSFASHYIMQGGNILALQQILGHLDIKHTLVYAHLAPDFLAAEMSRLKI